jgi:hypothetical protein
MRERKCSRAFNGGNEMTLLIGLFAPMIFAIAVGFTVNALAKGR